MPQRVALSDADREKLARVAHELWSRRMVEEGWRPGREYDPQTRTHDGLVPFSELDDTDRWTAELAAEISGAFEILARCIDYPRGRQKLLRPEELRRGLRVALPDNPEEVGEVSGWATAHGRVTLIRVRWTDGEETTHYPEERDLLRVGEGLS